MIRNFKLIVFIILGIFVFFILLNALEKNNNYLPDKITSQIFSKNTTKQNIMTKLIIKSK